MFEMIVNLPYWLAAGEALFAALLGALVLLVLWELAMLLAVLLGWIARDHEPRRLRRGTAQRWSRNVPQGGADFR